MSKILIIEDNPQSCYLLEQFLLARGDQVVSAENGAIALDLVKQDRPDLIISDIMMPVMNGFRFCREIKTDPDLKSIPLIFYTATFVEKEDERLALRLGASRFLIKPTENSVLNNTINEVLNEQVEGHPSTVESPKNVDALLQMYDSSLSRKLAEKVEKLQAEHKALLKSEQMLKEAQAISQIGHWEADIDNGTFLWSEELCRIFGFGLQNKGLTHQTFLDAIHPEDLNTVVNSFHDLIQQKIPYTIDYRIMPYEGHVVYVHERGQILCDDTGKSISALGTVQNVTQQKNTELELRESNERFRLLFEASPDPTILTRLDSGQLIDVNSAFESSTGISKQKLIGKSPANWNLWTDPSQRVTIWNRLKYGQEIINTEITFNLPDGETPLLLSARVISLNKEPCVLLAYRDISIVKEAEITLIETDKMKTEFISRAAHELRTPLSTIMGFTELLINPDSFGGFGSEERHTFLEEIYAKGEILSELVDDLLDVSLIESGHSLRLNLESCNLQEILNKTVGQFKTLTPKHSFQIVLPERFGQTEISIDRHRINQVLENLLSNAVKYSPEGSTITIKGQRLSDQLEVSVEDQGLGMDSKHLSKIFDKFYRADASNTAVSGLGLGMGIAKQIVEMHGGTIEVTSTEGKGTLVTFTIPVSA